MTVRRFPALLPFHLLFVAVLMVAPFAVQAATVDVPSSANLTNAGKRYEEPSSVPPATDFPAGAVAPAPAAMNKNLKQQFVLKGVKIIGATVYPAADFKALYQDKIGTKVSVADMDDVAHKIADKYTGAGYILAVAYIPKQTIKTDGVITIRVNEGYIGNVVFVGEKPSDSVTQITDGYVARLKAERPLTGATLERYLLLIRDIPGNITGAVLRPSTTENGATDIMVQYSTKPVDLSVSSDNRGSRYLGPWQTTFTAAENSLLGLGEHTIVRAIVSSPTQEFRYYDIQHEEQLGTDGTRLMLIGSTSKSEPGDSLKSLDVRGYNDDFVARVTHPFIRSRAENLTGRVLFDARNSSTDILTNFNQDNDHIRSVRTGGTYDFADSLVGAPGVNVIDAEVSQGIQGLGATDDGVGRSRINGKQGYTKANFDLFRTQALPSNFSLFLSTSGQYAFTPLLSSEQFLLGGPSFGTAYDPGELAGDSGLAGKAELRYGNSVGDKYLDSYQLYSYYDVGTIWRMKNLASEQARESLASAGVGIRANITENVSSSLELAFPLTKELGADPDNTARIFGGITLRY